MTTLTTYHLVIPGRPLTKNKLRQMNHYEQAAAIKVWRLGAWAAAKQAKIPPLGRISISAFSCLKGQRKRDLAAELPTLHACVDGLVDAKVIPDDSGEHWVGLSMYCPEYGCERDEFAITIWETPA